MPKVIYRFNTITIKTSAAIFAAIDMPMLKVRQGFQSRQKNVEKSSFGVLTLPNFKTYYELQ